MTKARAEVTTLREVAIEIAGQFAIRSTMQGLLPTSDATLEAMVRSEIARAEGRAHKAACRVPAENAGELRLRLQIAECRERLAG